MTHDLDRLESMLSRLKLTAIRDQLDNLLDQAARREMNLREALAFLCEVVPELVEGRRWRTKTNAVSRWG